MINKKYEKNNLFFFSLETTYINSIAHMRDKIDHLYPILYMRISS